MTFYIIPISLCKWYVNALCISHSSPGTTTRTLAVQQRETSGSSEMLGRRRDGSQDGPGEGRDKPLSPFFSRMLRPHLTATLPAHRLLSLVQRSPSASYAECFGCENQSAKWLIGNKLRAWALEPNRYGLESRLRYVTFGTFDCLFPHLQNGEASSTFLSLLSWMYNA